MLLSPADRFKRHRGKEREDWMWYEDPYKYKSELSIDWYDGVLESHGRSVPAPNPLFGTEPPIHAVFGTA
jgi:hypothetical protein